MVEISLVQARLSKLRSFGSRSPLRRRCFRRCRGTATRPKVSFHQVLRRLRLLWLRTCWPLPGL